MMRYLANVKFPVAESIATGVVGVIEPYAHEGRQKTSADGLPMWVVPVRVDVDGRSRVLYARLGADAKPEVLPGGVVTLLGLSVSFWSVGDRSGVSVRARGIAVGGDLVAGTS